jgi:hypothetical protein
VPISRGRSALARGAVKPETGYGKEDFYSTNLSTAMPMASMPSAAEVISKHFQLI